MQVTPESLLLKLILATLISSSRIISNKWKIIKDWLLQISQGWCFPSSDETELQQNQVKQSPKGKTSGSCKPWAVFLPSIPLCWAVSVLKSVAFSHLESIWKLALRLLKRFSGLGSPVGTPTWDWGKERRSGELHLTLRCSAWIHELAGNRQCPGTNVPEARLFYSLCYCSRCWICLGFFFLKQIQKK